MKEYKIIIGYNEVPSLLKYSSHVLEDNVLIHSGPKWDSERMARIVAEKVIEERKLSLLPDDMNFVREEV